MSYLSFENNIIEASGNLILKSTSGSIDCSGATISNVTIAGNMVVTSIEPSNNDISFNGSNLLDVSSIQVNNDVSCSSLQVNSIGFENHDISFNGSNLMNVSSIQVNNDVSCSSLLVDTIGFENHNISFNGSNLLDVSSIQVNRIDATDIYVDGSLTVINTVDLDISDNIIGLNRGHTGVKNSSGVLINYYDASNIFFGYHNRENAFVIADTSFNHNDDSRNIVVDNYVDLKVGKIQAVFDDNTSFKTVLNTGMSYIQLNKQNTVSPTSSTIGFLDDNNNVLYINNGDDMIQIKSSYTFSDKSPIVPRIEIGKRKPTSADVTDLNDFKHESNVMIQAPSFTGDVTGNLSGNAATASQINITNTSADSDHNIVFTTTSTISNENGALNINNAKLKYNPFTETLTSGSFNATSDYRTKTNIEELDENITVSNLRPLVYLKNGKKEIGLLAHELQEVYPFMVCGEKDGKEMQSVNYNGLIGVLINDIKRLTNENQILKLNNDTLKSDYDTLKSDYNTLKSDYNILKSDYNILKSDYNILKSRIDSLEDKFNKKFE